MDIDLVLWIIACVLFALAAVGVAAGRINLIAAGLFCGALTFVI